MAGPLPQAVLLDLDDTILDDSGPAESCWADACAEAAPLLGLHPGELREAIRARAEWFWSDPERHRAGRLNLRAATAGIVEEALAGLGRRDPLLARRIANRYRDLREERVRLVPGAVEVIERLRDAGVRLGMATNGSAAGQRAKIERFGLARYFDCILIEGEFGIGKPDRRVYEALFGALRAEPSKSWSVGDNLEWDVGGPQALGAFGVWVDVRGRGVPAGSAVRPDRIIRTLGGLLDGAQARPREADGGGALPRPS